MENFFLLKRERELEREQESQWRGGGVESERESQTDR